MKQLWVDVHGPFGTDYLIDTSKPNEKVEYWDIHEKKWKSSWIHTNETAKSRVCRMDYYLLVEWEDING